MKKTLKEIPIFETEDEEREFWGKHDSFDYVDWDNAVSVTFPNLKRTPRNDSKPKPRTPKDLTSL